MKLINCKRIEQKLIFYIDNELDVKESELVSNHINECEHCRYLYIRIKENLESLNSDKLIETNPFFSTRVLEKIKNRTKKNPLSAMLPKRQYIIQFSIYILLICFALLAGTFLGSDGISTNSPITEKVSDTIDYQLFADSYNYNFNQSTYLIKTPTSEE